MDIVEAIRAAFEGRRIRRKEWFFIDSGRCVYIYGYRGIDNKITYLLEYTEGSKEERSASFSGEDVLAKDWEVMV